MGVSRRIEWIDIAKAFGIILVSFGHIRNGDGESVWLPALDSTIDTIYLFHMPLFYILGGLTFSNKRPFIQFLTRKIRTLLVPYYFFSLYFLAKPITILVAPNLTSIFQTNHDYDLIHQFYDVLIDGNGLWFLMAFFVAELLTYGIVSVIRHTTTQLLFGIMLIVATYFWNDFNLPNPLPFQILKGIQISGFFLVTYALQITLTSTTKRTAILMIAPSALSLALCQFSLHQFEYCKTSAFIHSIVSIIAAFAGSVAVISASIIIHHCLLLSKIGKDSLVYYALNAFTLNIAKVFIFRLIGIDATNANFIFQFIAGIFITIISLALLSLENIIIQKWFWWVIGKPNPRTLD